MSEVQNLKSGHALAIIQTLERPEAVGINPEPGTSRWQV
ncbi:hypothetical protein ABIB26_003396 [Arthrobacter sp. UYEF20]